MMMPGGTINKRMVLRNALQRVNVAGYSANSLKLTVQITASGTFGSTAGYIDLRCASARGQAH